MLSSANTYPSFGDGRRAGLQGDAVGVDGPAGSDVQGVDGGDFGRVEVESKTSKFFAVRCALTD